MCVCARARARGRVFCKCVWGGWGRVWCVQGIQYYVNILYLRFYIFIFVDLVKRRVLIPAGEIPLYRNDDNYILLYAEKV